MDKNQIDPNQDYNETVKKLHQKNNEPGKQTHFEMGGKNQYDLIDFEHYDVLRKLFYANNFDPSKVTTLELTNIKMTNVPPQKCLKVLFNLQSLNLSNNSIIKFTSKNFYDCYWLTELNLSNNKIENLDNLQQLGQLEKLENLNFNGNPVTQYLTRAQIIRELLNPDKFKKYDPNIPKQSFSKEKMVQQEKTREMIGKTEFETINQIKKDILNGQNKQPVKTRVVKYAIYPAPKNRLFRFSNLTNLNEKQISLLEVFQATGTSTLEEIVKEDPKVTKINEKNTKRMQRHLRPQTVNVRAQSSHLNKKKKFNPDVKRDPQAYNQLVKNHHTRIEKELQKVFQNTNNQYQENDNDELKNFKIEPGRKFQILALADRFNPKRFTNDTQFKPEDLLYKDAQYEVSIEDHKKMLQDYENQKQKKILQQKLLMEKQNEKIQVKEKKKKLRQKVMFAGEHYKYEKFGQMEFDQGNTEIQKRKNKTKKLNSVADNQFQKSFSQQSESLSENLSQSSNQKKFKDIDCDSQKIESFDEDIEVLEYIEPQSQMKMTKLDDMKMQQPQQNVKPETIAGGRVQIFGQFKPNEVKKKPIQIEKILPNDPDILSKEKEDAIKLNQNETYQSILEAKNFIENSRYVLKQTKEMDQVIKIQTSKHLRINSKKNTKYHQILQYLKEIDKGDLSLYKDHNTSVLRELIYYINEYENSKEPKMTEKLIEEYLKDKDIQQNEADQLYKCIELIENQKIQNSKVSDATLKRIEKKEVDRAEANATLASHYLKIKKYYPKGKFDKFMKNLYIDDFSDHFGGSAYKKENNSLHQRKPQEQRPHREKGLDMKKLDILKDDKDYQVSENMQRQYPQFTQDVCQRNFEEQVDFYLRKMQSEMIKKNDKIVLTLEEKMIQMAQQLKENQKLKEQFIHNIDQIRPDKNQEFWDWVTQEHDKKFDKKYCFKEYVKQVREGKKK